MESLLPVIAFIGGATFGVCLAFVGMRLIHAKHKAEEATLIENLRNSFSKLSSEALSKSSEDFLRLAEQKLKTQTTQHATELEGKKQLIDQQLENMTAELNKVSGLVQDFEKSRAEKLGALSNELDKLTRTSTLIQQALADNRSRGQWGERIAEDILRIAGFIEGVNYTKQMSIEIDGQKKSRPDFTFNLPNGMCLNMDSKFPLSNYMEFLSAESDTDKETYRKKFLGDVRNRIKEIGDRGYINVTQNTLDCVLIFIPNEQIYRFIHEEDDSIINEALQQKVILCSPLTLYIVLAVIRQAVDNFKLQQSSRDILLLLSEFKKQWETYVKKMDDMGSSLEKARDAYDELIGKRRKALDKPINRIDLLMSQNGLAEIEEILSTPVLET